MYKVLGSSTGTPTAERALKTIPDRDAIWTDILFFLCIPYFVQLICFSGGHPKRSSSPNSLDDFMVDLTRRNGIFLLFFFFFFSLASLSRALFFPLVLAYTLSCRPLFPTTLN